MKKIKNICLLVLFGVISAFVFSYFNNFQVYAVSLDVTNSNYSSDYNFDDSLFRAVKALAKVLNNDENVAGFNIDIFSDGYKQSDATSEDAIKLKNDLLSGNLYLSTGENARYDCLKSLKIKSISGLQDLNLGNIKYLFLNDNLITKVDEDDFSSLTGLKTLEIKNNELKSFALNSSIRGLNRLDLSNNNLSQIDISKLSILSGTTTRPSCNLSNNNFSSLEKITFPNEKLLSLNLSFNLLTDLTSDDISAIESNMYQTAKPILLVQGLKSDLKAGDKITIYQDDQIEKLQIKICYNSSSAYYNSELSNLICSTSGLNQIESVNVPAGKIIIQFFSDDSLIDSANSLLLNEEVLNGLIEKEKEIALNSVSYKIFIDGKEVDGTTHSENMNLRFYFSAENLPNKELIESDNGAKIYLFCRGQSPENTDSLFLNENGEYNYFAYVSFDNIKSDNINVVVTKKDLSGLFIVVLVVVLIFVLVGVGYYVTRWIRDGLDIAPLSAKEVENINRRKFRKSIDRDDFIEKIDENHRELESGDTRNSEEEVIRFDDKSEDE